MLKWLKWAIALTNEDIEQAVRKVDLGKEREEGNPDERSLESHTLCHTRLQTFDMSTATKQDSS